jgi:hypothetical protein
MIGMSNETAPDAENANFYVVARQPGAENPAIPSWASRVDNPAGLVSDRGAAV